MKKCKVKYGDCLKRDYYDSTHYIIILDKFNKDGLTFYNTIELVYNVNNFLIKLLISDVLQKNIIEYEYLCNISDLTNILENVLSIINARINAVQYSGKK